MLTITCNDCGSKMLARATVRALVKSWRCPQCGSRRSFGAHRACAPPATPRVSREVVDEAL